MPPKLDPRIKREFDRLRAEGLPPSRILRQLIDKFGLVSPPEQADYFESVFNVPAIEFTPALGARLECSDPEIVDKSFDLRIARILESPRRSD